jgi:hypothetical protein
MNRRFGLTLAVLAVLVAVGPAVAESQLGSKAMAQVGQISVLGSDGPESLGDWQTILSNTVRTSQQHDLSIGVSLECGLTTRTPSRSNGGGRDTSVAEANLAVRVLVDGFEAAPGDVTFCKRSKTLSATFQGLIDGCLSIDDLGNIVLDEECLLPEEIELILDTMSANTFNFLHADAGVGTHMIEVQARIDLDSSAEAGKAEARAMLGKGSLTVEVVRLIVGEDIDLDSSPEAGEAGTRATLGNGSLTKMEGRLIVGQDTDL